MDGVQGLSLELRSEGRWEGPRRLRSRAGSSAGLRKSPLVQRIRSQPALEARRARVGAHRRAPPLQACAVRTHEDCMPSMGATCSNMLQLCPPGRRVRLQGSSRSGAVERVVGRGFGWGPGTPPPGPTTHLRGAHTHAHTRTRTRGLDSRCWQPRPQHKCAVTGPGVPEPSAPGFHGG